MPDKNSDNKALWMVVAVLTAIVAVVFALNPAPGTEAAALEAATPDVAIDRADTAQDYPVEAAPAGAQGE